jgi:replicative DNA helicase
MQNSQNQPNEAQYIPMTTESEEAVLGGILTNPNAFYEVIVFLKPEDFFMLRHRYVYEAMIAITERKDPLDYLTVIQELKAQNHLGEIGGPSYLTTLINNTPTSMHTTVYGHLVQRAAIRRQLMQYGQDVIKFAADEKIELSEVINKLESKQIDIAARYTGANTQPLKQAISAYYARLEALMDNPQDMLGVPTGFTELDRVFMGFDDQSLTLLGARPGMGKTSMMLSTALNMAKAGMRVGYFSMEMGVEQLMTRLVAMESGINAQRLRSGQLTQQEWGTFVKTAGDMNELPIFVDDTTIWTPLQLHAKCASMKRRLGLDIIMIDYVGLMSGGGKYRDNKVAEAGYISRSLKGMARDLKTAVWGAIQLNRNLEQRQDKRPILSDLRESGDYEQDADNVLFIYRDEVYNEATEFPNQADIIIAKHRNGPVGTVPLYFEKSLTKFQNAATRSINLEYLYNNVGSDE